MKMNKKIRSSVSDRPYAIPIEMRPLWRICLIIISIAIVSGDKKYLDIKKINILVWMLIRKSRWKIYEEYLLGRTKEIPLISVDTATYKAIEFSHAKKFIEIKDKKIYLTSTGCSVYDILIENNIMNDEMEFLHTLGAKVTEGKVKDLTGGF